MILVRLLLACLLLLAAPALAEGGPHVRVGLVAESATPAAGRATTLAITMAPSPGWHGYWQNPGDAGTPTQATWRLPAGVKAGALRYPVPTTLIVSGLMNYVYEAPFALLVQLDVPAGLAPGTRLPIAAKLDYLVCTTAICVPEKAEVAGVLTVGSGAPDAGQAPRFAGWRAALPRPLGGRATVSGGAGRVRIGIPLPAGLAVSQPYFFPLADGVIDYAAPQAISRNGDALIVEAKAAAGSAPPARLAGVLRIGAGRGLAIEAVAGRVPAAGVAIADDARSGGDKPAGGALGAALLAFGAAILGGLLLNIMPCVFPILSLKAIGLARAGGSPSHARAEALAYAGGVILVCVGLGALLLGLRAGGHMVGWAFQLQDPRVIAVLLLLVTGIALNLAGLFELGTIGAGAALADKGGAVGAFWTGALAAFVATPCTGPFMGAALGAALVLPAAAALAVFAGLGIGLALPFVAIGFSARLRALMPRPGAWMETMRRIMAVPMFVTALGLAWVLGRQAGPNGMGIGLAAALLLGLGLWWMGARQRRLRSRAWAPLAPIGLAALALATVAPQTQVIARPVATTGALAAEPFSAARLAALRGEGRPVFVYFTADWCLTCKVNEKTAIERAEVSDAFARARVVTLVGDWTDGDAAIGRFLEAHGRSGVPLYLFYGADGSERVLPQLLTPGRLAALAG